MPAARKPPGIGTATRQAPEPADGKQFEQYVSECHGETRRSKVAMSILARTVPPPQRGKLRKRPGGGRGRSSFS